MRDIRPISKAKIANCHCFFIRPNLNAPEHDLAVFLKVTIGRPRRTLATHQ